jgi:hypothetical protein
VTATRTSPSSAQTPNNPKTGNTFAGESKQALDRLRDAVRRVLAAAPSDSARPKDLGKAFDLDYALAWQIHALAHQSDPLTSARVIPKSGAMERFVLAAAKRTTEELAAGVRDAYEAFEQLVSDLAEDRDTFDAMLTLQHPQDGAGLRRIRRAAHRANAAAWGVTCRCKTHMTAFRIRPTGEFDAMTILGYVGLQRLHAGAMISTLASSRAWGKKGPADGTSANHVCELIEEACSRPLLRIEGGPGLDDVPGEYLVMDGLGKRSVSTVYWRNLHLAIPDTTAEPPHNVSSTCRIPAERLVLDFLLPRGWVKEDSAQTWITPDSGRYVTHNPATPYCLPFEGAGRYLGRSLSSLHTSASPHHADLMRAELERMGWQDTEFDIFRCEVEYPLLHSSAILSVR